MIHLSGKSNPLSRINYCKESIVINQEILSSTILIREKRSMKQMLVSKKP